MEILEEHHSPDGFLHLLVTRDDGGDFTVGFAGYEWHTHGDILAWEYGLPEPEAVREFVKRVTADEEILVVSRVNGSVRAVWPSDEPIDNFNAKLPEEVLAFRRWSGAVVRVDTRPRTEEQR